MLLKRQKEVAADQESARDPRERERERERECRESVERVSRERERETERERERESARAERRTFASLLPMTPLSCMLFLSRRY
jgi:hypothetical protein